MEVLQQLILFGNFLSLMKIMCIQMYQLRSVPSAWPEYILNRYYDCQNTIRFVVNRSRQYLSEKTNRTKMNIFS